MDGWKPAAWAAPCPIYEPASPSVLASVPPLAWGACSFQPKVGNCAAELQVNWASPLGFGYMVTYLADVGGKVQVSTTRSYDGERTEWVIADETAVHAAWRVESLDTCLMQVTSRPDGEGQVVATERPGKNLFGPYHAIWGSALTLSSRLTPNDTFTSSDLGAPSNFAAVRSAAAGGLSLYQFDALGLVAIRKQASNTTALQATTGLLPAVTLPDAVFFTRTEPDRSYLAVWTDKDGLQVLFDPGANAYVHDVASDGVTLTWIASSGLSNGEFASSTLYRSPFGTTSAQLAPTKLLTGVCATIDCHSRISGGHLFVAHSMAGGTGVPDVYIVRLSDGGAWLLEQPVPQTPWSDGWVIGSDLYLHVFQHTIQRIPLASLGAPITIP